jgi:hypothetical protein
MSAKQQLGAEDLLRSSLEGAEKEIRVLRREHECRIVELKQSTENSNKLRDELQKVKYEAAEAKAKIRILVDAMAIMSEAKKQERSPNNSPTYNMAYYPPWEWPGYCVR